MARRWEVESGGEEPVPNKPVLELSPASAKIISDNYVFLIGRPPIGELLGFIRTMAVDGQNADQGELTKLWRGANDHVRVLESMEVGIADDPPTSELPQELQPLADELLGSPVAQRAFRFLPTSIRMVELDRLVVFQKFINLGYVDHLKLQLGTRPTAQDVFRLALPSRPSHAPVRIMQNAANVFSFLAPSTDFRFIEAEFIDPAMIQGFVSTGWPSTVLAIAIGYGTNFLNVVQAGGRLILSNGSHRAYALRDAGVTHVPCLVQHVSRPDELELVGIQELQQAPDRYLKALRPPLLKDYFDERLRLIVPVCRKDRLVRIQFGVEQTEIPAA